MGSTGEQSVLRASAAKGKLDKPANRLRLPEPLVRIRRSASDSALCPGKHWRPSAFSWLWAKSKEDLEAYVSLYQTYMLTLAQRSQSRGTTEAPTATSSVTTMGLVTKPTMASKLAHGHHVLVSRKRWSKMHPPRL